MIRTNKLEHQYSIQWQWPLQIALANSVKGIRKELLASKWPKKFTDIEPLNTGKRSHYNILIITKKDIPFGIISSVATAEFIFVLGSHLDGVPMQRAIVNVLSKRFEAGGVFSLFAKDISRWFSDFIINLSHDQNIVEALEHSVTDGDFYYDPNKINETRLSAVVQFLARKLSEKDFLHVRFPGLALNAGQIAMDLKGKLSSYSYLKESGDASDLLKFSKPVFEKLGKKILGGKGKARRKPRSGTYGLARGMKGALPASGKSFGIGAPRSKGKSAAKKSVAKKSSSKAAAAKKKTSTISRRKLGEGGLKRHRLSAGLPKKRGQKAKKRLLKGRTEKRAINKKPSTAQKRKRESFPRFLQAKFNSANNKTYTGYLKPSTKYKIEVRIGYEDEEFARPVTSIGTGAIFKDSKQKEETITIQFKSNFSNQSVNQEIVLPRIGNSNSAFFDFSTNKTERQFQAEVAAFHKNRLIQKLEVFAEIKDGAKKPEGKNLQLRVVFCIKKQLAGIENNTPFAASIEYKTSENGTNPVINGISNHKPVDLFLPRSIENKLEDLKKLIENAVIDISRHPANLRAKGNQELLLTLALNGSVLYKSLVQNVAIPDGPLQIITNHPDYVPLDLVYSKETPSTNARLCKHAETALKEGNCKNCPDYRKNAAAHICPFGFWSLSRVIERHNYQRKKNSSNSDYCLTSEPAKGRDTLNVMKQAIFGCSSAVEAAAGKGKKIRQQIIDAIKKSKIDLVDANDWNKWEQLVKKNRPDSLILIVHIEKDQQHLIDKIEIGTNEFLPETDFGAKMLGMDGKAKTQSPLVIVIGCESSNFKYSGFDVSSILLSEGAAIVLSNFTKIRGRQAKEIVINLVQFLKQNPGQELFGQAMLRLRQYLLSEGIVAGLSLVALGDADWKIKT